MEPRESYDIENGFPETAMDMGPFPNDKASSGK
jgi:hypothetical protein